MKIVKRILAVVGALLLLAVLGVVLKFYVLSPKMRPAPAMTAPTSPEAIARGKYLVHHVTGCVACHSPVRTDQPGEPYIEEKLGAGRVWEKDPSYPDWEIIAPNITPDKDTGLGNWSDGEIARAIREGVSKDGRPLFPMMPFQTYAATLSDDDTLAIIAYLRTLAPQSNKLAATKIGFPVSMFVRGVPALASVAYADGVVVAVAAAANRASRIGVDVERLDPARATEVAKALGVPVDGALARWTLSHAVLKAGRHGRRADVGLVRIGGGTGRVEGSPATYRLAGVEGPKGYAIGVAW